MTKLVGRIYDKQTGEGIEARVQVRPIEGRFLSPPGSILKVGPGQPFFYSDREFEIEVPRGSTAILVERGTEYVPARLIVDVPARGIVTADIEMERWSDLEERGWHPGNTHLHYDQYEQRPDERLRLDPRVEDLRVTAISILTRWDRKYAVNKYSPGVLTEFCSAHHHVECGVESRHDPRPDLRGEGYGHIMLLRLKDAVEPVSRGYLVDETDPDYPPLCYACDETHRQGGVVIWCHNGRGMEAPVAAVLGKLDAFNLFDPFWTDPEYDIWYAMLNCGLKLPASTGSDWFLCSGNRVYAYTGEAFRYDDWMQALREGRTFITNGPALSMVVDDQLPGQLLEREPGDELVVDISWKSHYAIHRVDIIWNGKVVATQPLPDGSTEGQYRAKLAAVSDGWIAARLGSTARDSFSEPIYAHTSPVYVVTGAKSVEQKAAASRFDRAIEEALAHVGRAARFHSDRQRQEVLELFRQGQALYRGMMG